jgi:Domain of unknown function (DUF4333)
MLIKPILSKRAGKRPCRTFGVLVAVLLCALPLGACGSSSSKATSKTNLNTSRVARSIEQSILSQRKLKAKVTCPALVPQEAGRTFECQAVTRAARAPHKETTTPFLVTVQNARGYVTYVGGKPH